MRCRNLVDAGVGCRSFDVLARVFRAGGAAIFACAEVLDLVFIAGVEVAGLVFGVGTRRLFFRIVMGNDGLLTGLFADVCCCASARVIRWLSAGGGLTGCTCSFMLCTLGSVCCCCLLCSTNLCRCSGWLVQSSRTVCSCWRSLLVLNAGRPRMVSMHDEMACMILSAGVTVGFVMHLCWKSTVSLK